MHFADPNHWLTPNPHIRSSRLRRCSSQVLVSSGQLIRNGEALFALWLVTGFQDSCPDQRHCFLLGVKIVEWKECQNFEKRKSLQCGDVSGVELAFTQPPPPAAASPASKSKPHGKQNKFQETCRSLRYPPRALLCNLNVPESLGTILLTDASSLVPRLKGRQALPDTQATIIVAGRADICRIAMIQTSMQFTLSTVHFSHVSISVLTASPKAMPSGGFILSGQFVTPALL
jgi:hypothetical protein